jgi:SpoVK/Ycf46/Vps4 family AAA+-type ATPase
MGPLRDLMRNRTSEHASKQELRAITRRDFDAALRSVKASVSSKDLAEFEKWNEEFGTQQL